MQWDLDTKWFKHLNVSDITLITLQRCLTDPTNAENLIHVIWFSNVIKTGDSGLHLSLCLRFLLLLIIIIIIIPIYCCFPFLLFFPCLPLWSNFLSFISLTSLLPTVPQAHSVYTTLLHTSLFPIFCCLPFKFLKQDFKSLLTQKISIFKHHFAATFLSLQLICTMQHFVMTLIKQ